MIRALALSVAQLGDRAILAVIAKSLLLTFAILSVLGGAIVVASSWFGAGWWQGSGTVAAVAAVAVALLGGVLLFRAVAVAVVGLFADDIVRAVERRHYPAAAASAHDLPFRREAGMALRSAGRAVLVNLLALPLYLLLLATGVGAPLVFVAVNMMLLGRDLGEMVAARHMDRDELAAWLATSRRSRAATGLVAAILFVVPLANLLAPVLGAAIATHRFHGARRP